MRFAAFALVAIMLSSALFAYQLKASRDEMLAYYYAKIDDKIPNTARALVGDERVNVLLGGRTIGIETRRGELYSFELFPVDRPTMAISVSDDAAEKIARREMGILQAIDSGGIRIESKNWFTGLKVEALKRVYAVSRVDEQILGIRSGAAQAGAENSIYIQRSRIAGCLFC